MKKTLCLILSLLLVILSVLPALAADGEGYYTSMPQFLQLKQETTTEKPRKNVQIRTTLPTTANPAVDAAVAETVRRLTDAHTDELPQKAGKTEWDLDVGPVVYRTGTSWMSFLTIASLAAGTEQIMVDYECHVYDIATGEELRLTDVFPAESGAWAVLRAAAQTQLTAYFPDEQPDAQALDALLTDEALQRANFTMGMGRIMLTWRADTLYPGRQTLMHVFINYQDVRAFMTEEAMRQTDNSRFRVVALTYDDGPAFYSTRQVISALRTYGQQATFFCIGFRLQQNPFNVCREHDAGYTVASHTWWHRIKGRITPESLVEEQAMVNAELISLIGLPSAMVRAPGGQDKKFAQAQMDIPIFHWNIESGDATGKGDPASWARRVNTSLRSGDIVLMHDLNSKSGDESRRILSYMEKNGIISVTLDELFAVFGVTMEPNMVYYSVLTEPKDWMAE